MAFFTLPTCISLLINLFLFDICQSTPQSPPSTGSSRKSIAIIGAGAAGSSAAYHLSRYSQNVSLPISITVFDRNDYIGGRSTTVPVYDDEGLGETVELGASIFVPVNRILFDAVKEFNLSIEEFGGASQPGQDAEQAQKQVLGIWNGDGFVYTQDLGKLKWWQDWWTKGKLLWRYGLAPVRTVTLMKKVTGKFFKMYDEPVFPWRKGLSEAVEEVGLLQVTAFTGEQFLEKNNIAKEFAREIIQSSTRVNYAQNLGLIHGLETMVCMATDGAMSVSGGNFQIFSHMLKSSAATVHLSTRVEEIRRNRDKSYTIKTSHSSAGPAEENAFDAVILAAPYHQSNIKFTAHPETQDFPSHVPPDIKYVNLHVTLFTSPYPLSPFYFKLASRSGNSSVSTTPAESPSVPQVVLTTLPEDQQTELGAVSDGTNVGHSRVFSISTLRRIRNKKADRLEYVYKIFSPEQISDSILEVLVDDSSASASHQESEASSQSDQTIDQLPIGRNSNACQSNILPRISWVRRHVWQSYPYLPPRVTFEEQNLDEHGLWYSSGIESFISTMETSALMGRNIAKLVVDGWQDATLQLKPPPPQEYLKDL